jgi:hypothetical protein
LDIMINTLPPLWMKPLQFLILKLPPLCGERFRCIQESALVTELTNAFFIHLFHPFFFLIYDSRA